MTHLQKGVVQLLIIVTLQVFVQAAPPLNNTKARQGILEIPKQIATIIRHRIQASLDQYLVSSTSPKPYVSLAALATGNKPASSSGSNNVPSAMENFESVIEEFLVQNFGRSTPSPTVPPTTKPLEVSFTYPPIEASPPYQPPKQPKPTEPPIFQVETKPITHVTNFSPSKFQSVEANPSPETSQVLPPKFQQTVIKPINHSPVAPQVGGSSGNGFVDSSKIPSVPLGVGIHEGKPILIQEPLNVDYEYAKPVPSTKPVESLNPAAVEQLGILISDKDKGQGPLDPYIEEPERVSLAAIPEVDEYVYLGGIPTVFPIQRVTLGVKSSTGLPDDYIYIEDDTTVAPIPVTVEGDGDDDDYEEI